MPLITLYHLWNPLSRLALEKRSDALTVDFRDDTRISFIRKVGSKVRVNQHFGKNARIKLPVNQSIV